MKVILLVLLTLALLTIMVSFGCYLFVFHVRRKKHVSDDVISLPEGKIYEPFREIMTKWILEIRQLPYEKVSIVSHDGLRLTGKYYEFAPGAPIELMFHGYRGNAERDLSGGVQRCFKMGRSALLVDQRCSGGSDGNTITFGVKEHLDCLNWIDFMIGHFGPDVKIILTGISMGASTVLLAAGTELPSNVIGVLADCGFTSSREIIMSVADSLKLPAKLCYPFVRLGARLFGHFDPDAVSSREAVQRCKVPVIFFHGEDDAFVPCHMSRANYQACVSRKTLVTIPGAGHGLSYPVSPEVYLRALWDFFGPDASHESVWDTYLL